MDARRVLKLTNVRWEVSWYMLTFAAEARRKADPDHYEHDHDDDEEEIVAYFPTKEMALAFAKTIDLPNTVYGSARIIEQRRLPVEGTDPVLYDWEPVDEGEDVTS